jgi:hypothetical protein
MNLDKIVHKELLKAFGRQQLNERLWLSCDEIGSHVRTNDNINARIILYVSKCPGGAYSQFGTLWVKEDLVYAEFKTVWAIVGHRARCSKHNFSFCDPNFPDNLVDFSKKAAANAQKCFDLSHARVWRRHRRKRQPA